MHQLGLFLVICGLICVHAHPTRLALATQGKASNLQRWIETYSRMNSSLYVTMFLLTYDEPVSELTDLFVLTTCECNK